MGKSLDIRSTYSDYKVEWYFSASDAVGNAMNSKYPNYIIVDKGVVDARPDIIGEFGETPFLVLNPDEGRKTLETVGLVSEWLIDQGASKTSQMIAIGGGFIQDIVTFTAEIYYRRVPWVLVPTTLLSMCDSCIGGKCALNHGGHKNQLGVINPPKKVLIALEFLDSLSDRDVTSGFGELLKLSLTGEKEFYDEFKRFVIQNGLDYKLSEELVFKSLVAKKWVIEQDERENDLRRILNYGHTFGHAIESQTKHSITHGEAILIGMDMVNKLGLRLGITDEAFANDFESFVKGSFGFQALRADQSSGLFEAIKRDKKVQLDEIFFAFVPSPGKMVIQPVTLDSELEIFIEEYFKKHG